MTHNEIYIKFMIEYDKANVTSSYPSLTKQEIAVILNKAYLALIAQKVTGNNVRRAPFEADTKAISDIQALIQTSTPSPNNGTGGTLNSVTYNLPDDFLYYVAATVQFTIGSTSGKSIVTLVDHNTAERFKQTIVNRPWIKNAVCEIASNRLILFYDNYDNNDPGTDPRIPGTLNLEYIQKPAAFTQAFNGTFELNDSMAEELITLAITFALENVESTRIQTQTQIRGLEA